MYAAFLKHFLLPIGSFIFSGNYTKYLNTWRKQDAMSPSELETLQKKKLAKILTYAKNNVPFYNNLNLPENASIGDFPILTKTILRNHTETLISTKFSKEKLEKNQSSGSSGVQSFTYMTHDHKFYLRALQTHWWTWGGYTPGVQLLQAGMSVKRGFVKTLKDFFFRVSYMNAFALTTKNITESLDSISNTPIKHLAGYPSALNEIAKIAIKEGKTTPFTSVVSYGDKLFEHHIKNFNAAFNNPTIINTYGCAEGLLIACKADLPYYYIMSPHVFVEIVDANGSPVEDGIMGHILVTGLTSFSMPLIRYKLGDLGVLLPKANYPKIRRFNYPLLQEVIGRETDVIKTPNGNVLIVHSFTGILEYVDEIKQFKVIQTAIDKITIEYCTDNNKDLSETSLKQTLDKLNVLAKNTMQFTFVKVSEITPSPSGKPQIIEIRVSKNT